jgi:hypothetical protein
MIVRKEDESIGHMFAIEQKGGEGSGIRGHRTVRERT